MKHLEHPILTLVGRLHTLKAMLELHPDDERLKNAVSQHDKAVNILKKYEEKK